MRTLLAFLAVVIAGCATVYTPPPGTASAPAPEPAPPAHAESIAIASLLDCARAAHRAAQSAPVAGARARAPEAGRLRAGREHRGALQLLGRRRQRLARRELAPYRACTRGAR